MPYLDENFVRKDQDKSLKNIKRLIKQHKLQFDGFIVRGLSGIIMGAIAARSLKKDLVVVRKNQHCHSWYPVEGYKVEKKYIILDDFKSSGDTVKAIREAMQVNHEDRVDKKYLGYSKSNRSIIIGEMFYSYSGEYKATE